MPGYPLQVFGVTALVDLLHPFRVHTEQSDKLGWFGRVFCSPSNHRAHHKSSRAPVENRIGEAGEGSWSGWRSACIAQFRRRPVLRGMPCR